MLRPRLTPILFSRQVQPASFSVEWGVKSGESERRRNARASRQRFQFCLPHFALCILTGPPCYFDTIWQWLAGAKPALNNGSERAVGRSTMLRPRGVMETAKTGAAGRIPTCIVPFRRRMPHEFDHGSNLKLVGMAGFSPATSRAQAGRSKD